MEFHAAEERRLDEASKKPAFKVPEWMINDWPGDRFTDTHRCFGGLCKNDPPPTSIVQVSNPTTEKTFKVGDL